MKIEEEKAPNLKTERKNTENIRNRVLGTVGPLFISLESIGVLQGWSMRLVQKKVFLKK